MFRARYFPGWLGLLYMFAGACYLGNVGNFFLGLHLPLVSYLLLGSFVGEAAMALWLLTMGVDGHHWQGATSQ